MRIARFSKDGDVAFAVVEGDELAVLDRHPFGAVSFTGERVPVADVRLLAPMIPSKVVAIGKNYADHAREMGGEAPASPVLFMKPSTAVCGPGDPIQRPAGVERLDFEGELAVVIGRLARDVPVTRALGRRPRLHLRQRRHRAGPAEDRRAVDARQGLRHVLPDRAVDRDRSRPR
jgi:2-keto-4-pentenoate hydratase/2-oxohepta-3-ene-1,7-dioic acid hydratase in catechol pathway